MVAKHRLLRECLRLILESLGSEGTLALYYEERVDEHMYLVYKPGVFYKAIVSDLVQALEDKIEEEGDHKEVRPDLVLEDVAYTKEHVMASSVAMLHTSYGNDVARQVGLVAAKTGEGANMYGMAMAHEGPIMPSRSSITAEAQRFWQKQYERGRGHQLTKGDGATLLDKTGKAPWIDSWYDNIPSAWDFNDLIASHEDAIKRMVYLANDSLRHVGFPENVVLSREEVSNVFVPGLGRFFDELYKRSKDNKITSKAA